MSNDNTTDILKPFYLKKSENLQLTAINFENGIFLAFSDISNLKLGTVALSLPFSVTLNETLELNPTSLGAKKRGISATTVFGTRNEIYTKALAEKISIATKKLVYLSINFEENNNELYLEALSLCEEFIKENIKY